jgi:ABC-type lipoprotein export system ATPase subunit
VTDDAFVRAERLVKVHAPGSAIAVRALDDVDVRIARGEYVAIVGESGSGKTTLMHMLGGLDRPTSGTIAIDGIRLDGASSRELAAIRSNSVGFIFQGLNLIPTLSALENVVLAARYARRTRATALERATALLTELGLGDRLNHRPAQLSGGQQQRVAIARALINEPALVLADEPTGELDSRTAESILALFDVLHARGQTLIIVTHSAAVYDRAQRIIRLADGKIAADAS